MDIFFFFEDNCQRSYKLSQELLRFGLAKYFATESKVHLIHKGKSLKKVWSTDSRSSFQRNQEEKKIIWMLTNLHLSRA